MTTIDSTEKRKFYQDNGFAIFPSAFSDDSIASALAAGDDLMAGIYETDTPPRDGWNAETDDPNNKIRKIDQPQLASNRILDFISEPLWGEWIADVLEAKTVQVWAVQFLHKPCGGDGQSTIGWHQDFQYWQNWWTPDSNVFTAWVALSDVTAESGPMCFLEGSNNWGFLDAGDFFGTPDQSIDGIPVPDGEKINEVPGVMSPGEFSIHHCHCYHGSHPNTSNLPRRSLAVHMRTEASGPTPDNYPGFGYDYIANLGEHTSPVIFSR